MDRGLLGPLLVLGILVAAPGALAKPGAPAGPFAGEDPALVGNLRDLVDSVSGADVYDCIEEITMDAPYQYRVMGTPTHQMFIEKYGTVFTDRLGLKSQVVPFDEGAAGTAQSPIAGGANIIGVLPGRSLDKWVVLGGHHDTREATFGGGALDNTSGICTVLEIATSMVELKLQPEATMVFAWWDGEEWGLYGSRAFLADHSETKKLLGLAADAPVQIVSALSFDMVGLNYPAMNTWVQYGETTNVMETAVLNLRTAPTVAENFTLCPSYGCYKYEEYTQEQLDGFVNYQALVREVAYGLLELPQQHVWVYDDQYGRSDHVPFIAAGIPGMRVQGSHDEEFPHYHQPTDTIPGLVALAGSEDNLKAGFNTGADVGAATMVYAALKGTVGTLGTDPLGLLDEALPISTELAMPGFEFVALAAAAVVAGALVRRRA